MAMNWQTWTAKQSYETQKTLYDIFMDMRAIHMLELVNADVSNVTANAKRQGKIHLLDSLISPINPTHQPNTSEAVK